MFPMMRNTVAVAAAFFGFMLIHTSAAEPAPQAGEKAEVRKGTVTGIVTARGEKSIEVQADGEEKARRYVPNWKGGAPKDGGGLDKDMLAQLKTVTVKSRVRIEWIFEERFRVVKLEVLKKAEEKK